MKVFGNENGLLVFTVIKIQTGSDDKIRDMGHCHGWWLMICYCINVLNIVIINKQKMTVKFVFLLKTTHQQGHSLNELRKLFKLVLRLNLT